MNSGRQAIRNLFCALLVILLGLAAPLASRGGERDEARIAAERERILRELDATQERIIKGYVAEQEPGPSRADVNLIVGTLYEMGKFGDGEPDPVRAASYYEAAAAMGSENALCALGHLYAAGAESPSGTIRRDPEKAMQFFERAAEVGSVRALVELGIIYADGKNVDPDPKLALDYFTRAAKHGDPDALDRLEPVMRKAREWEDARPGRKAGFPTSKDEIIDKALLDANIDMNYNLQMRLSEVFVELNKRIMMESRRKR